MKIRFRFDRDFAVDLDVPLKKLVHGYAQLRTFLIGTAFRLPALARAVGEFPQAVFVVMATGSEGGALTVDVA